MSHNDAGTLEILLSSVTIKVVIFTQLNMLWYQGFSGAYNKLRLLQIGTLNHSK